MAATLDGIQFLRMYSTVILDYFICEPIQESPKLQYRFPGSY